MNTEFYLTQSLNVSKMIIHSKSRYSARYNKSFISSKKIPLEPISLNQESVRNNNTNSNLIPRNKLKLNRSLIKRILNEPNLRNKIQTALRTIPVNSRLIFSGSTINDTKTLRESCSVVQSMSLTSRSIMSPFSLWQKSLDKIETHPAIDEEIKQNPQKTRWYDKRSIIMVNKYYQHNFSEKLKQHSKKGV